MQPISSVAPALAGRVILRQRWSDLVFLHWRVPAADVEPLLPAGIVADEFDGSSWVGLIPFRMSETRPLGGMQVPYFGSFTEVNVRLYGVDASGRRGVVFASLEASRLVAVAGARVMFSLPYYWAKAGVSIDGERLEYRSTRIGGTSPSTRIVATRGSREVTGDPLADFLTARWLLFETRGRHTVLMPNQHDPWRLFDARLIGLDDELVAAAGLRSITSRAPDSVLYSPGVYTDFGMPVRIG